MGCSQLLLSSKNTTISARDIFNSVTFDETYATHLVTSIHIIIDLVLQTPRPSLSLSLSLSLSPSLSRSFIKEKKN
jgi:hypothetical protein